MTHTIVFSDFPQLRTGGRTETARQPITAEPRYPALAATIQPLEDLGQLRAGRGLSVAKEPISVEPTQEN
jgi:hypothetical protein